MDRDVVEDGVGQIVDLKPPDFRVAILRFGFAFFCTAVATYIRVLLTPYIDDRIPFGAFFLSVMLVAWMAGTVPAIFALLLSTLSAAHYVVPPEGSLLIESPSDQISLAIFFAVGFISIALYHRLNSQRAVAEREAEKNELLNRKLLEADERKDDFLSLLAHELRCPLAPMSYSADTLEKIPDDVEQVKSASKMISRNLKHLVRLVDDLLDVSRYSRGEIFLRPVSIDIRTCLASAVEMVQTAADAKNHELFVDVPIEPIVVNADPVRCCQVICNLLTNAVKYTPPQGRIQISLALNLDGITIVVEDNGIGISELTHEQVFEPFFQVHSKRSRFSSGMGLGLAIGKTLAELHGGRIDVASEGLGRGSKFSFHLPASLLVSNMGADSQSYDALIPARNYAPVEAAEPGNCDQRPPACRVLVVDDDSDTAKSLSCLLTMEGFETQIAHDGLTALNVYRRFKPKFVVLDIGLPGIDGYETARRLRLEAGGMELTIVAVSGWGNSSDRELGIEAGFSSHLVKPIMVSDLLPLLVKNKMSIESQ